MGSTALLQMLLDASVKGTVLLAATGMATLALYRQSASVRNLAWTAAVCAVLVLPLLAVLPPAWEVPLLPDFLAGDSLWGRLSLDEKAAGGSAAATFKVSPYLPDGDLTAGRPRSGLAALNFEAPDWAVVVWALGALVLLVRFGAGKAVLRWISRKAEPVTSGPWISLLDDISTEIDLSRPVRVLKSPHVTVAFTRGIRRADLVLPAAADRWTPENLRLVMLHEMAHIKRRDTVGEFLVNLATILYWFHPLVWLAAHQLRVERERACDDAVLNSGTRPSDYASQLLEVAQNLRGPRIPLWQAAAISQGGSLKDRLLCILDAKRKRSPAERWAPLAVALSVAAITLSLAVLTPWAPAEEAGSPVVSGMVPDLGARATGELVKFYKTGDAALRQAAVTALAERETGDAAVVLRRALVDPDAAVRQAAAKSWLSKTDDPQAAEISIKALWHEDPAVRGDAALSFLFCLDPEHPKARETVLKTMSDLGHAKVFGAVATSMDALQPKARAWAGKGFVKFSADQPFEFRKGVVDALGARRDPMMMDALTTALLNDEHPKVRVRALEELAGLVAKDQKVLKGVLLGLKDKEPMVRKTCLVLLAKIGDSRAQEFVVPFLKDPNPDIRKAAEKAMESFSVKGLAVGEKNS